MKKQQLLMWWALFMVAITLSGCASVNNIIEQEDDELARVQDEMHDDTKDHEYVDQEALDTYDLWTLSEQEIADIIHMRQEEKLARDVYRTLGETYAVNQFMNIPESEQNHTDAMEMLLARYEIEDPITDESAIGVYKDETFVTLYNDLIEQWSSSLVAALTVWATIEDMNMAKLQEVITNTDNEDIAFVYESVLAQSHHHMQAFINGLQKQWASYTPEYVSQEYFAMVIAEGSQGKWGNHWWWKW